MEVGTISVVDGKVRTGVVLGRVGRLVETNGAVEVTTGTAEDVGGTTAVGQNRNSKTLQYVQHC